jgi:hypothetical protein
MAHVTAKERAAHAWRAYRGILGVGNVPFGNGRAACQLRLAHNLRREGGW